MAEWISEDEHRDALVQRADENLQALALLLGSENLEYGDLDDSMAYVRPTLSITPAPRVTRRPYMGDAVEIDADFQWDFRQALRAELQKCVAALSRDLEERPVLE